jgi:hypothetical protein
MWISGWAICPDRFKAAAELSLPNYRHIVLAPTAEAVEIVVHGGATRIGGYSLGSLLLLSELARIPKGLQITCLAPFIAFCRERQLGGTTPRASLRVLQQRLNTQPDKAIKLFYRLAGLNDEPTADLPYPLEDLIWGLEQLSTLQVNQALLNRAAGIVGLTDPLVDATVLTCQWTTCHLIKRGNHAYHTLLAGLSQIHPI